MGSRSQFRHAKLIQTGLLRLSAKYGLLAFEQHDKLNGEAIDIAGDAKTMPETAQILGKPVGKSVMFVQVPIEEVRKFSEDFAIMLEWFDRVDRVDGGHASQLR